MNNKGQTTIFFSLIISVMFLLIFSALEITRIHMGKVKMSACVHSMRSSIMADYNSILFERYHLMFLDPGYGTGSEALAEEKISDYLETSLNGEDGNNGKMYQFALEEIAITGEKYILDENMKQVKKQIVDYEKAAGLISRAKILMENKRSNTSDIQNASRETDVNGVELNGESDNKTEEKNDKPEDPREKLQECLKLGILNYAAPGRDISKKKYELSNSPSSRYKETKEEDRDTGFGDIVFLKRFLKNSAQEDSYSGLIQSAAFVDYVICHFSNQGNSLNDSELKCEVEYILKGKDNDYDNLEAVVTDITWMRMPVNYAYLLTDVEKKSEALTLAAAICTATGTPELMEVVKYLLLGCWAYGETLYEMRSLLEGEKIPYVKTKENWNTELKTLAASGTKQEVKTGLDYEDYLMLLLARKNGKKEDICYARMLDVIELNLQKVDAGFRLTDCVGGMTVQGKISINSLFVHKREQTAYEYYFEETFSY